MKIYFKKYIEGVFLGLGLISILVIIFGLVFAVGFHNASEIVSGVFQGNYTFNGTLNIISSIVTDKLILGGDSVCNNNSKGSIRYNETNNSLEFCNGLAWFRFAYNDSVSFRDLKEGLKAYWNFDTTLEDIYSGTYNITTYGNTFVTGKFEQGLNFDGNDYAQTGIGMTYSSIPSYAFWFKAYQHLLLKL